MLCQKRTSDYVSMRLLVNERKGRKQNKRKKRRALENYMAMVKDLYHDGKINIDMQYEQALSDLSKECEFERFPDDTQRRDCFNVVRQRMKERKERKVKKKTLLST